MHSEKPLTCTQLARDIEVTTRTIKRDVDFMKCRLNLPIEYDSRRFGYYYSEPVDQFPSLPMTEAEVFAMLIAALLCWRFAHKFLVTGVVEGSEKYDVFISYKHIWA